MERSSNKRALKPLHILYIFSAINLFTYFDRGVFAATLDTLEKEFHINHTSSGILGGGYIGGYVVASPIFSNLVFTYRPMKLCAFGLVIWSLSVLGTSLSVDFWTMLTSRIFSGVGEASFLCIAPAFVDRKAPNESRSAWLAIFYTAIPMGMGLGYGFGGAWIGGAVFGSEWTWRTTFIFESILIFPFILVIAFWPGMDDLQFHGNVPEEEMIDSPINTGKVTLLSGVVGDSEEDKLLNSTEEKFKDSFFTKIIILSKNSLYITITLAYAAQTFVVGGFAYWGVEYAEKELKFGKNEAGFVKFFFLIWIFFWKINEAFGGVTIAMGIIGSAAGGYILDRIRSQHSEDMAYSLKMANKFILFCAIMSCPFALMAFMFESIGRILALLMLAGTEFFLFACLSPINSSILWSVPEELKAMAVAMSVVFIHVLGDGTSPFIFGLLLDAYPKKSGHADYTKAFMTGGLMLILSVILFFISFGISKRRLRKSRELMYESVLE